MATEAECALATRWLQKKAGKGSGYGGADPTHFHTKHEALSGLFIQEAAMIAARDPEDEEGLLAVELFLNLSTRTKMSVEAHFGLKPLHFQMNHMVCREKEHEEPAAEEDDWLSHGVHVDNCNTTEPDTCAYDIRYRDWSSVPFLSENFTNGRFGFFDAPANLSAPAIKRMRDASPQVFVQPRCG